ncbi:hypothetical protein BBW65_01310 [Helicobacter enhydrae]|uniref:Glycosyltransferase n=1 Tax=Helicobacter enhydrae TaxID=222136 RepID=A0A1B1U425_9HELI|nr:hypothetical protein [Helicobacter enhydrae]ANV97527.1 hypothetical protein BBW65_01310 [Helicobacter enhydrae]
MKIETLKKIPRFIIETAKNVRKVSLYQETWFLNQRHREISWTQYAPQTTETNHRIVVSLTTHKERIEYLHFVLDSLYMQTLPPAEVQLYVAKGEYTTYPKILEKFQPWLKIIEVEDLGSYKKFIPALLNASKSEVIISLDDDFIYPHYLISSLYSHFLKNQNSLVGYCGFKNGKEYFEGIAGGLGILWNPNIFNIEKMPFFFDQRLFMEQIGRNYDDGWISLSCLEQKIQISCIQEYSYELLRRFYELPSGKLYAISSSGEGVNYISAEEKKILREKTRKIIQEQLKL